MSARMKEIARERLLLFGSCCGLCLSGVLRDRLDGVVVHRVDGQVRPCLHDDIALDSEITDQIRDEWRYY